MPRPPRIADADPRRAYNAVVDGLSDAAAPLHVQALAYVLAPEGTPAPEDAGVLALLPGVTAAYSSFLTKYVRNLFDACLLGKATDEDLQDAFGVSLAEASAYRALFFDRTVFTNDFHVLDYVAREFDKDRQDLLKEAFKGGFRAMRFRFASETQAATPRAALERLLDVDSQSYVAHSAMPMGNGARKNLDAVGKRVIDTAAALMKISDPKKVEQDEQGQYVIESGPVNPTIEDLRSHGIHLEH